MRNSTLNRICAIFLQIVLVLIGIGILAFMLWEPHIEGRNMHATPLQIYFGDPFLAYAYTASIPGFMALYQIFRLLGYAGQDRVFSPAAARAWRIIKICALALIGFVVGGEAFLLLGTFGESDDRAGGVAMGVFIAFGMTVIAASAAMFERQVQQAAP